jgi:hypothetical protein
MVWEGLCASKKIKFFACLRSKIGIGRPPGLQNMVGQMAALAPM